MQRNWIGKSTGAEFEFNIVGYLSEWMLMKEWMLSLFNRSLLNQKILSRFSLVDQIQFMAYNI